MGALKPWEPGEMGFIKLLLDLIMLNQIPVHAYLLWLFLAP